MTTGMRKLRVLAGMIAAALLLCALATGDALAANPAPSLSLHALSLPTVFSPSHNTTCSTTFSCDEWAIVVHNSGAAPTKGETTITDELPAGVSVVEIEHENSGPLSCEAGPPVKCVYSGPLPIHGYIRIEVKVLVEPSAPSSLTSHISVSGGGAPPVSTTSVTSVGEQTPQFGFSGEGGAFAYEANGADGTRDNLAADHPNEVNVNLQVPSTFQTGSLQGAAVPVENVKNLAFYLPLGALGDPQTGAKCPSSLLVGPEESSLCPPSSQVGDVVPNFFTAVGLDTGAPTHAYPVFNMVPEKGYPAQLAFRYLTLRVNMYVSVVRHEGQYRLRVSVSGLPRSKFRGIFASFFGDLTETYKAGEGEVTRGVGAFLTNPSDCSGGPLTATVEATTWEHPEKSVSQSTVAYPQIEGCNLLSLPAEFSFRPETAQADEPSGYTVGLRIPQAPTQLPNLGTPPLKDVSVKLPPGVAIAPGGADGLRACQATGSEGLNIDAEAIGADGQSHLERGHCPNASQVASVSIVSPDLGEPLTGKMFIAEPECGGSGQSACTNKDAEDGTLFRAYVEAEAPEEGVIIKLPGTISANTSTGQLTASFTNNPQFPLSDLTVHTVGGPRGVLANPQTCGAATAEGDFTPWGAPLAADTFGSPGFVVDANGAGGACSTPGFAPSFTAGTLSPLAGAYSPFTLTIARQDREQDLSTITTQLPTGLLAAISNVPRCAEAQAQAGTCSETSKVGSVLASAGSGSHPYFVSGKAYLTGPYRGAPFGLSVVVPAVAGPFNLGTIVVRVALYVDPADAHVTAVSDPLPQMLLGVPLRVRTVSVTLDRPQFTFNATNCEQKTIDASIGAVDAHGTSAGSAQASSPYAAAGCDRLPFKPTLSASVGGKASRANGASFTVKITAKPGDANIRRVDLQLPRALPSRQSTLKHACGESQFNRDPAGCPKESFIGSATARTPVLNAPLTGPAILVSHGGAAFPDVEYVLQAENVKVVLDGKTNIEHNVTYSMFETVPDAPVTSFETTLPGGPHSIFGAYVANGSHLNLCGHKLLMPTSITGQNGAVVKTTMTLGVTGCAKVHKSNRNTKGRSRRNKGRRK